MQHTTGVLGEEMKFCLDLAKNAVLMKESLSFGMGVLHLSEALLSPQSSVHFEFCSWLQLHIICPCTTSHEGDEENGYGLKY